MTIVRQCTWVDCENAAYHLQIAKDGERWADLCDAHDKELNDSIVALNPRLLLRNWTLAGGGSKKMAARMMHDP